MSKNLLSLVFFLCSFLSSKGQTVIHSEDFSGTPAISWIGVDEGALSPTDIWRFTAGYAQINGFGDENDLDWLISPAINMDNSTAETFTFKSKNRYTGATTGAAPNINLELKYTTNYTGNPATTTWINIPFPASVASSNNTTSTISAQTTHAPFDISSVSGANVRFAFRYYGLATASKEWQIDDIEIAAGGVTCVAPITQATAPSVSPSTTTATINWTKGDGKSIVIISDDNAVIDPVNGTTYTANAAYSAAGQQVIYTGTAASVSVTGLTAGTNYYVKIYNFSDCNPPPVYITATPAVVNFTTSTVIIIPGGEPAGYYNAAAGLTCAAMRNALSAIIANGYVDKLYGGLWNTYATSDIKPGTTNQLWCIYTTLNGVSQCSTPMTIPAFQDGGTGGTVECQKYNREHTIPQSWFSQNAPMVSDAFHVLPTDKKVNNVHGNQPYGMVGSPTYTSINGTKYGLTSDPGVATGNEVMEPSDEFKGDIARIYMYMATRYGAAIGSANTQESNLVLDDTNWPAFQVPYLKMLLRWHAQDPVSQKEIDRNNVLFGVQKNRNPYVDHPEFAAMVWSNACSGLASLPVTLTAFEGTYRNRTVELTWKTESENQVSHYEIERSFDGKIFEKVGTVKANNSRVYNYYDATEFLPSDKLYYRLKMVDLDGQYDKSRTVSVILPKSGKRFAFSPNPAKSEITLQLGENQANDFELIITDMMGRVWLQKNLSNYGVDYQNLDISSLPSGNYIMTSRNQSILEHQRLTVVR